MLNACCYGFVCFTPLNANTPKFFGFSEFIAGLALMVLAWTIADVRYRFRIKTAPLPLQVITFAVVGILGILTLLTDLWRAEQWLVPKGNILSPSQWQAILGFTFLFTFLIWAWFAFIRPPIYGKLNAKRYAHVLYRAILRGSPSELSVIADEFARSARTLIHYAPDMRKFERNDKQKGKRDVSEKLPDVIGYANDILLLIADKRFCRVIVESSLNTALALFDEIGRTKKFGVPVSIFAKNIVNEALANKNSFLFHETEGYESGLFGYQKPLSQAMFSNYVMADVIDTLLDPDFSFTRKWDAEQWRAYCRIVLLTFQDYIEHGHGMHSFILYRATGYIEHAVDDLYKINGSANTAWDDDLHERLRVIVNFIQSAIEILDKKGVPKSLKLRVRDKHVVGSTFYDHLAAMIFEIIFCASAVRSPVDLCWWVQHNSVWGELFNFTKGRTPASKVVQFKLRRLIYDEVVRMKSFPNFKGAKILGFCLNVMGLTISNEEYFRDSKALQKVILSWTKKNYAWLYSYNPRIAESCLVDSITYDQEHFRLVKTYPADGLRREPHYVYFNVDSSSPEVVEKE